MNNSFAKVVEVAEAYLRNAYKEGYLDSSALLVVAIPYAGFSLSPTSIPG